MEGRNPDFNKPNKYPDKEGSTRMLGVFHPAPFMMFFGIVAFVSEMYVSLAYQDMPVINENQDPVFNQRAIRVKNEAQVVLSLMSAVTMYMGVR